MGFRLPTLSCFTPLTLLIYFAVVNMLTYVDRGIVPGAMEQFDDYIKDQFHTNGTKELAGVLQSSFIAGYGVASLTFGHLVHAYPPFRLMFLGLCVWMGSIVLSGLAPNYYILVLARVFSGVGEASFQTVAPPFIDDNAPADKKALWLSIFFMAIPVGTALGFAYSSIVASSRGLNLGWRAAFLYEIPAMVPLALMALFVPKKYAERRAKGAAKSSQPVEYDALAEGGSKEGSSTKLISAADDADDSPDLSIKDELRNITRSPVYLCSVAGYAAYTFVTMGFATFGSDFLLQMHIFPSEESASITFGLIVALAGLIGTPAGGMLLDRLADPTSQVHKMQTAFRLLAACMATGFAFCVVGTQMQTRWPMMAFLFVGCIALFATTSMSNVAIMWSVPVESRAFAIGFSTLWMHLLGDVPSPILIGILTDHMAPSSDKAAQPHRLHVVFLIICLWLLWAVIFYGMGWILSVRMQRSYARMLGDEKMLKECNYVAHEGGTRTTAVAGGRLKVQTAYGDNVELVEEYDQETDQLLVRKWREKASLGGWRDWFYEIGEAPSPVFVPQDSREAWVWRVRNLPYPADVYLLSVDEEKQQIILRTTNRKYFKRFDVPALVRAGIPLDVSRLRHSHENNTLVIRYAKPSAILELEARERELRKGSKKEGDVDCKQQ